METIEAVKCKCCQQLKEPKNFILVKSLFVNSVNSTIYQQQTRINNANTEWAFCDSSCLTSYIKRELNDEIPF